jgi:hypothetical protein
MIDDMTPSEVSAAVGNLIALITHAPACKKRLEKLELAEAAIKREAAEVAAMRDEIERKLNQIDDRILQARRREFEASRKIMLLRDLLGDYEKTKLLPPLPENFESESAELIAEDENASTDWIAAAEARAAARERERA